MISLLLSSRIELISVVRSHEDGFSWEKKVTGRDPEASPRVLAVLNLGIPVDHMGCSPWKQFIELSLGFLCLSIYICYTA